MLKHVEALEVVALPMLIYDYVKTFKLDNNQTIENYLSQPHEELEHLSQQRKEALTHIKDYAPHGKVVKFISDEKTDLQVAITISENTKRICVVFRGSESLKDWWFDLQFSKVTLHDDIHVHRGFYSQLHKNNNYEKIKKSVKDLLIKEEYKDYTVCVTGHSLGGALCTLFGYELSREIKQYVCVISFASPRVGGINFRKAFDAKENLSHYRFTNNRDVVTALFMIGYKHVGINIHVTPTDFEIITSYADEDGCSCKNSLFNFFSISDHNVDLYYENIKNNPWGEHGEPIETNDDIDSTVHDNNGNLFNNVNDLFQEKLQDIKEKYQEKVEDVKEKVEDVKEKVEDVKEKVQEKVEDVKEKVEDVKEKVQEKVEDVKEKVEDVKEKVEDVKIKVEDINESV